MFKIVSNSLSPNLFFLDFFRGVFGFLLNKKVDRKKFFEQIFGSRNYLLLNSARAGLGAVIEALDLPEDRRVVGIPAFICGVVAVPFLARGFRVEWIDVDERGLMDFEDFVEKSGKISALVAPHVFGQVLNISKFATICRERGIFLIEDCAHYFPISQRRAREFTNSQIHEFLASVRILSFGREKVCSCVSGGAVVFGEAGGRVFERIQGMRFSKVPRFWVFRRLFQILIFSLAIPVWRAGGRVLPWFFRRVFPVLPWAVSPAERAGREDGERFLLPEAMQWILRTQFLNLNKKIEHQKIIGKAWIRSISRLISNSGNLPKNDFFGAKIWSGGESFFRVIVKFRDKKTRDRVAKLARGAGFALREWDGEPISPAGTDLAKFGYEAGSCAGAEDFSGRFLTFPTNLRTNLRDVEKFERIFGKK